MEKHTKQLATFRQLIIAAIIIVSVVSTSIIIVFASKTFYYIQINQFNLVEQTGVSYLEIKQAYSDIVDFCFTGENFSTGVFKHTIEGKRHFEDVHRLLSIDLFISVITAAALIIAGLTRKVADRWRCNSNYTAFLVSGIILVTLPTIFVLAMIVNFDYVFRVAHRILFPGKTNWVFSAYEDEIIQILPAEYFMRCIMLVMALTIVSGLMLVAASYKCKNSSPD